MTERKKILADIVNAMCDVLDADEEIKEDLDGKVLFDMAAAALRVVETPPTTKDQKFGRCTCNNNGYTEHSVDCEMYAS